MNWRLQALLGLIALLIVSVFFLQPIPQDELYHNFADTRALLGIPNFLNVASNFFFLIVGLVGIVKLSKIQFVESKERWPSFVFFTAVMFTAFGSAYYHLQPGDNRLVWDRLPMALGFMALVSAVITERISVKIGLRLIAPLCIFGAGSVVYWNLTQTRGHGDLRLYLIAQFGSLLVLLFILAFFPPRYTRGVDFIVAFALYALAKVFETADRQVFALGGIVSGHTLKHIAAALSAYWILRMLRLRTPANKLQGKNHA